MAECNHDCASCQSKCSEATSLLAPQNAGSNVKHVIGVVKRQRRRGKEPGHRTDGHIAQAARVCHRRAGRGHHRSVHSAVCSAFMKRPWAVTRGFCRRRAKTGVKLMSINLLLEHDTDPVVWRGALIAGTVKQFWTDVLWGDVDFMFVDMPPGTGDVPLTVFQSLPVDGIIIVASPQELVGMIVEKAVNMAKMMNISVLGVVENMSWIACPDCGKKIYPFGEGKTLQVAQAHSLPLLAQLPIQPELASACDKGLVELFNENWLDGAADVVEHTPARKL